VRRVALALAAGLAALLAGAAGLALWARQDLARPRTYPAPVEIVVERGETARAVLERLAARGVIGSPRLARLYLGRVLGGAPIHAGEYRFEPPTSTLQVLDRLVRGAVATHAVTVVEGLTLDETVAALAAAGFGDRARLRAEFAHPARVADLDPAATDLEGYLFPDTYRFPRGISEDAIADALVANFRARYEREVRPLVARGDERPVRELVILASLVEKEARLESERPLVAGVYANRLRRGIGLYADPTLIYGLKLEGRWDGDLRRRDLASDSPWNTYRTLGLPPGPICSPGSASLAAAARPADVPYLYFVSRNDGSHVFAETLAEHNRNVDLWQRRYFRARRPDGAPPAR